MNKEYMNKIIEIVSQYINRDYHYLVVNNYPLKVWTPLNLNNVLSVGDLFDTLTGDKILDYNSNTFFCETIGYKLASILINPLDLQKIREIPASKIRNPNLFFKENVEFHKLVSELNLTIITDKLEVTVIVTNGIKLHFNQDNQGEFHSTVYEWYNIMNKKRFEFLIK